MTTKAPAFNQASVNANLAKLNKVNDVAGLVIGSACGILQFEGLHGFLFYAISYLLTNAVFVVICCEANPSKYFASHMVFASGFTSKLAGFIMMWCLTGALVKV
ncbi:ER membrane protein complex subunit 6 [Diutina catenulata]